MPLEPDDLCTLHSMAVLAGRQVFSAHCADDSIASAFYIINDEQTDCWYWGLHEGLKQLTISEMQIKQLIGGFHYYSDDVWARVLRERAASRALHYVSNPFSPL